tara:strand:- start:1320 stop:1631 length:312 start_codon:yes stop_codon:yes gene_type:complete
MITNDTAKQLVPIPDISVWMVENVGKYRPTMAGDVLRAAITACNTGELDKLIFAIRNWEATVEELSRPEEEQREILEAMNEVRTLRVRYVGRRPPKLPFDYEE